MQRGLFSYCSLNCLCPFLGMLRDLPARVKSSSLPALEISAGNGVSRVSVIRNSSTIFEPCQLCWRETEAAYNKGYKLGMNWRIRKVLKMIFRKGGFREHRRKNHRLVDCASERGGRGLRRKRWGVTRWVRFRSRLSSAAFQRGRLATSWQVAAAMAAATWSPGERQRERRRRRAQPCFSRRRSSQLGASRKRVRAGENTPRHAFPPSSSAVFVHLFGRVRLSAADIGAWAPRRDGPVVRPFVASKLAASFGALVCSGKCQWSRCRNRASQLVRRRRLLPSNFENWESSFVRNVRFIGTTFHQNYL